MTQPPRAVFRVDSSARMGSGHVMRCLALAEEFRRRGVNVSFVCREHPGHLIGRIEAAGFTVARLPAPPASDAQGEDYALWLGVTQEVDASETQAALGQSPPDWLVVDHYGLGARWETALRAAVARILVIDDLADRQHECDAILDQNHLGARTDSRYDRLIPSQSLRLLGPKFALLRPEYAALREVSAPRDGIARRLLVFFGGSDPTGSTSKVLRALDCAALSSLVVDVVIGVVTASERIELERWVTKRGSAHLHERLPTLAGLMLRADVAVGAGGSTTWERACLRLPSLVATIAHNQAAASAALADAGCQVLLGDASHVSIEQWRAALIEFVADVARLKEIARCAGALVDGDGCSRVVDAVLGLHAQPLAVQDAAGFSYLETPGESARPMLRVNVLTDAGSWIIPFLTGMTMDWMNRGHRVRVATTPADLRTGDVCFLLGCSQMVRSAERALNPWNLVVHASALPQGRGWSPMTWQVLENRREITVSLFEAADRVDSGRIHLQATLELQGGELVDEWRERHAQVTGDLCGRWLEAFPAVIEGAREQVGEPTYYPRRGPADSRLDPDRSIAAQFDLLRTVDNARYPAFFDYRGRRYQLLIRADDSRELKS